MWAWSTPPAPPPPPEWDVLSFFRSPATPAPPSSSVYALVGLTRAELLGGSATCAALAVTILIVGCISYSRSRLRSPTPLVSVEAKTSNRGRVAVLNHTTGGTDGGLARHIRRLLLERGFAEVRSASTPADLDEACRGAHLAVDLAILAPASKALDSTDALLRACASHGVRSVVQCSDALVEYNASADVCDGDEMSEPGVTLFRTEPRPLPPASPRQAELRACEGAMRRHRADGKCDGALVLRLHRVFGDEGALPTGLLLALASGLGLGCGARAQTTLLHVEDAALGVTLAAEKVLGGDAYPVGDGLSYGEKDEDPVETIVLADPALWSVAHLLRCTARQLRLPVPLLPLLLPLLRAVGRLLAYAGLPEVSACMHVADVHACFSGLKASTALGFTPKASAAGVHAALTAVAARCGAALRFAFPLEVLALALLAGAYDQPRLGAAALAVAVAALAYALAPPPQKLGAHPPLRPPVVAGGYPLLGHLLDFMKGPVWMIDEMRQSYRSVFTINVGPQRITFMVGGGPQWEFIKQKDEVLDQAPVYGFTIPVFGKGIIYDSPLHERQQQVKLLVHSMNTKGLEAMVPKMIDEAEDYFAAWGDEGTVELRKVFSELIIMTASSCLMGPEVRENLSTEISRIYTSLDGGLTPLSTLWPSAPTAAHRERDAARKEMVAIFSRVIASRRSGTAKADDFLQRMIDFRYKDETDPKTGKVTKAGRGYTDEEVTGLLIVLLFAGQHTSSITSTWLGAMLLKNPAAMAELKAEQERMVPDEESLNYHNLLEMDCMRRAITETLRLYPPLILLMRKAMKDLKVGGHTIPKGDVVGLCAPTSNLDPRYWSDALDFQPERYLPGAENEKMFDSRSCGHGLLQGFMMSFGGGAHMCSGRRFGYLQVSTIWTILMRDFDMEMTTPLPKPAYNDMVVGPDAPILMKYKRKVPLAQALEGRAARRLAAANAAASAQAAAVASGGRNGAAAAGERRHTGGVSLSRAVGGSFPHGPMVILWGSQTGTAEGYANQLMREARQVGFDAQSIDLEKYGPEKLAEEDEAPVVFLMATHGEGEPTDNAAAFLKYFRDERCSNLKSLRYAVFALGNRQYEHFCKAGKDVEAFCQRLGADRIYETGLGDDDDDLEGDFENWRAGLWATLCGGDAGGGDAGAPAAAGVKAPASQFECEWLSGDSAAASAPTTLAYHARSQPKHAVFEVEVAVNRELAQKPAGGSVKHVELLAAKPVGGGGGAPLAYRTADDLNVCCDNGEQLARGVAKRLGLEPSQVFALRPAAGSSAEPPLPTPATVEQALRFHADVRAPVSKEVLLLLAEACADAGEAEKLRALTLAENKQRYTDYILRDGRGLAELLDECPSCAPPWASLLELAPKLTPRAYTISSAGQRDADAVHLTVKVLREPMRGADGRTKEGVCSTQLGALRPGATACVFVRSSGFALPADPAAPIMMVGPGTGIAPFRAFLRDLEHARRRSGGKRPGHVRLYFGCRRPDEDFLYKEELDGYLRSGTLSSLRTAFSRAQAEKVYVQHRVREDGAELWRMLEAGGHFYLCGGTSMGRDVVAALQEAVATHGKMSADAAARYVKDMQEKGRLVQELWS